MDPLNSTDNDSACISTKIIADTPGFDAILLIEIFLGFAASIPNLFLMCIIWRVTVFHSNLRLCLAHLSFILLWYSFGYMVKAISLLPVILSGDPCTLITYSYECKLREIGLGIPAQALTYAGMAVALERLYSTLYYKKYDEDEERRPYLGIALIIFAYIVPVANTLNSLFALKKDVVLPICENALSSTPASASTTIGVNLTAMLVSILIVGAIWRINDTKLRTMVANRANSSLAARFQIEQNVQVNKIIVPSTCLQMLCIIPNYVFLFLILVGLPLTNEQKIILIHCNYIWKQGFAIMHPVVCFARHARIRQEIYKSMQWVYKRNDRVGPETTTRKDTRLAGSTSVGEAANLKKEMDTHFQMLSSAWNAPNSMVA